MLIILVLRFIFLSQLNSGGLSTATEEISRHIILSICMTTNKDTTIICLGVHSIISMQYFSLHIQKHDICLKLLGVVGKREVRNKNTRKKDISHLIFYLDSLIINFLRVNFFKKSFNQLKYISPWKWGYNKNILWLTVKQLSVTIGFIISASVCRNFILQSFLCGNKQKINFHTAKLMSFSTPTHRHPLN